MVQAICLVKGLVFRLASEQRNALKQCMYTVEATNCNLPVCTLVRSSSLSSSYSLHLTASGVYFLKSPKRTQILRDIQEALHDPVLSLIQPGDTRWTSHYRAVTAVVKCLPSIVVTLQHIHQGSGDLSSEAGGLLLTFQDHKSVLLLFAVKAILNPVCKLLSVRVEFAGSKIAITTANFGGLKKKLYPIAALKLGFMMICAISPYSIPVKS